MIHYGPQEVPGGYQSAPDLPPPETWEPMPPPPDQDDPPGWEYTRQRMAPQQPLWDDAQTPL
jgi:hypothetical protein